MLLRNIENALEVYVTFTKSFIWDVKSTDAAVWRCSVTQVFLKFSQNSQENTCVRDYFLIKLQASSRPSPLLKKRLRHRNLAKFLRTPFFIQTLQWLLLRRANSKLLFDLHEQIMSVKKDLKHLKMQEVGLPGNRSIFINTSLCPYYRMLWSKCKRLHDLGKISNFYISSGTIKVKISENRNPISITHTQDFVKYFPEVDLLPTS